MKHIHSLGEFSGSFKNERNDKPVMIVTVMIVMIITVDGGLDENQRYMITMECTIDFFLTYDLDTYFIATNIPGRSEFNRVERRTAPLCKEMASLILDRKHFGTHLNSKNETTDKELELRNFEYAGSTIAKVWSLLVISGHPTVAEYISKEPKAEPTK